MAETVDITFKTITQQTFVLSFNSDCIVGDVKKRIEEEKGVNDFEVERQKLIYNGKVLEDGQSIKDVGVDPKKFVVIMVSRKKPAQPAATEAKAEPAPEPANPAPAPPSPAAASTTAPSSAAPAPAAPPVNLTPEQEEQVNTIVGMGYPRDEVVSALRAAFFNADRAVEYLCTGIPATIDDSVAPNVEAVFGSDSDETPSAADSLAFLRNSPQFRQICQLVRENPQMLGEVLGEVSNANPPLFDAIRQNQQDFLRMLNEENIDAGDDEGGDAEAPAPPAHETGAMTIAVTESDREAIHRLQSMGFPEQLVIEAYFACDKNENLAVNYILQRMEE